MISGEVIELGIIVNVGYIIEGRTGGAMRGFRDATRVVDEPNEARMHFRTKPRIKIAIQQAAAHCGTDLSVFTMSAAYHAAMAIIAAHERTVLQPVDHEAFFAALDTSAEPNDVLRSAFRRHGKTFVPQ